MVQEEERLKLASLKKKKTFKNIIFLMKAEIKIGEQEGLLSFNSQTFLIENFKDTSVLQVGFWKKQFFWFALLCVWGGVVCFLLCFLFGDFLYFLFCLSCFSLAVQALSCSTRVSWAFSSSLSRHLFLCSMGSRTCSLQLST